MEKIIDEIIRIRDKKLEDTAEELIKYKKALNEIADTIEQNTEILLNGKIVRSEIENDIRLRKYRLNVVWEFNPEDLIKYYKN